MRKGGVVVTGMGVISALGRGVSVTRERLYEGYVQPAPEKGPLECSLSPRPAVFYVEALPAGNGDGLLTRTSRLALEAVGEAFRQAFGDCFDVDLNRVGVCLGTTVGCAFRGERLLRRIDAGGRLCNTEVDEYLKNDLATVVGTAVNARGPRATVSNACASGTDAIGVAAQWIGSGRCDVTIAGGADELDRYPYLGFFSLKNMALERCRPFDRRRAGLNLGEGAGILILEAEEHARERGARIVGRVLGYGAGADAYHLTAPHPRGIGIRRAIGSALAEARLEVVDIAFANAHGTATTENDVVEGRVFRDLFGSEFPFISTKGSTGHTLGAAGAIEAVFCLINLSDRCIGPSAGFEQFDPECGIAPVDRTLAICGRAALSTSLAFGGAASALVLGAGE
ncbi:MAG: beta-ketoacyl-[acyl-carrier-protein] synthase family protein [Acidobacteriota bacterium]|nr:beta-ketoacyl-[acyl-carrier-protein] synthase family protein [Acidobacteriota bacterium]